LFGRKKDREPESPPPQKKKEDGSASLLAFLTGEAEIDTKKPKTDELDGIPKPRPKERPSRRSKSPKGDQRYSEFS
jgi:hypothetical protein